tara:strand:- start:331 stop:753 length:423 start_codon:yes stop_codon:yes gene_type:complete
MNFIEIDKNNSSHIEFLYCLLKNKKFNISHEKLPSHEEHVKFVKDNPYRKWFLISIKNLISGSVYITYENHIGINLPSNNSEEYYQILKFIFQKFNPLKEIKSIRNKHFMVNTVKENKNLINAINRHRMREIQRTYIFKN